MIVGALVGALLLVGSLAAALHIHPGELEQSVETAVPPPFVDPGPAEEATTSASARLGLPDPKAHRRPLTVEDDEALRVLASKYGREGAGTKEDPIVLSGPSLKQTGLDSLMFEGTRAHLVIKDLELTGSGGGTGLSLKDTSNVTLRGLLVSSFQYGVQAVNATGLVVDRSSFYENQWAVMVQGSADIVVRDNEFLDNRNSVFTQALRFPDGEQTPVRGIRIVKNAFSRTTLEAIDPPLYDNGSAVVLDGVGHEVFDNTFSGHAPAGLRLRADEVLVEDNRFIGENKRGVIIDQTRDVMLRGNVFQRNLEVAVFSRDTVDTRLEENEFDRNPGGGLMSRADKGMEIERNRFGWSADAIYLWDPEAPVVKGNTIYGGTHGVRMVDGAHGLVEHNEITSSWSSGVSLYKGSGHQVMNNTIASGKKLGIHTFDTQKAAITGNLVDTVSQGIVVQNEARDIEVRDNRVKGLGLVGLWVIGSEDVHLTDNVVSDQDFGLLLTQNATRVHAEGTEVYWNQAGVHIEGSHVPLGLWDIESHDNRFGLWVQDAAGHDFQGLGLDNNSIGVFFVRAHENILRSSTVLDNQMGMYFVKSTGNLVYDNLVANPKATQNVLLSSSPGNEWSIEPSQGPNILGGPWIAGNWWHDYEGADVDGDGLGDVPYQPIPYHPVLEDPVYGLGLPMGPFDLHPLVHEGRSPPA